MKKERSINKGEKDPEKRTINYGGKIVWRIKRMLSGIQTDNLSLCSVNTDRLTTFRTRITSRLQ